MGKLNDLEALGQAIWLDFVERKFLADGGLQKLVDEDGVTGVTSNPSIFEKAMGHGDAYDDELAEYDRDHMDAPAIERYESLAISDIRAAADILRPVYDRLDGKDGYVSLEVSPYLADDTDATIAEAQKLWAAVDRPNVMIKIPGTAAGIPAISATIAAGINVNVTLLFAIEGYKNVAHAYATGLEERLRQGQPIDRIASVASFFVSRIDSKIDDKIDALVKEGGVGGDEAKALKGKVAIANAKLAYAWWQEFSAGARWQALAAKGAQPQRLLWASTGTKNPDYPPTLYLDTLIGPETVNTVPPKTLDAYRESGTAAPTLTQDVEGARHVIAEAQRLGLGPGRGHADAGRRRRGELRQGVRRPARRDHGEASGRRVTSPRSSRAKSRDGYNSGSASTSLGTNGSDGRQAHEDRNHRPRPDGRRHRAAADARRARSGRLRPRPGGAGRRGEGRGDRRFGAGRHAHEAGPPGDLLGHAPGRRRDRADD